jgi:CheY-like chemotaxis protein
MLPTDAVTVPVRNGSVLVVDDDDTIRHLLIEYLRDHDLMNVVGARDGVEALHEIHTSKYAVMILDVMMPKMSGVDVLDSLEALTSDPSVRTIDEPPAVLIITSAEKAILPDDALSRRCPRVVQRVFRKPLDVEELAACVERYLEV